MKLFSAIRVATTCFADEPKYHYKVHIREKIHTQSNKQTVAYTNLSLAGMLTALT